MKIKNSPETYLDLLENIFKSKDEQIAAVDKFFDEVYALRVKYRIPDVHIVTSAYHSKGKKRVKILQIAHFGYGMMAGPMLMTALNDHMKELAEAVESAANLLERDE
jgi:hypothetical protein